jgi:alcohol dehydrogenase (cytochrome c)
MTGRKHTSFLAISITSLSFAAILAFSPFVAVGQQSNTAAWNGVEGNYPFNWAYNPQNQINPSNVQNLQVSWLYPVSPSPAAYAGKGALLGPPEGISISPIIVNGISYIVTNYHLVLAQNAKDGSIIWQKELPFLKFGGFNNFLPGNNITGHYHAIWYTSQVRGQPLLWVVANNYTVFAFNALTGDLNLQFNIFTPSKETIPGNFGYYGTITPTIVIDERRSILVAGVAVSEGTDAARGFHVGFDVSQNPPKLLWRSYMIPPQDGSDPNWAISSVQNMSHAWIFDPANNSAINLKALSPSGLSSLLYGDWGNFGYNGTHSYAGAGPGWGGSWALDQNTGIAYVGTAQPSPDWNGSTRPGPNLWSDSVIAFDDQTGKTVWAFQTSSHDLWDIDCSWSVMLANVTIAGQTKEVAYKGCKNGYLYALDAATGQMYWSFHAPSIKLVGYSHLLDPTSSAQMKLPWLNYPSKSYYAANAFNIESSPAFDPTTNTIFITTFNLPGYNKVLPIKGPGIAYGAFGLNFFDPNAPKPPGPTNATVWGVDASTGQPRWHYDMDKIAFRGGVSTTGGMVFVPRGDGFLTVLGGSDGKVLLNKFIGGELITQASIGADANGNVQVVMPASGAATTGFALGFPSSPGFMFALSLPAGAQSTTSVSTSVSTSLSTIVSTLTVAGTSTGIDPTTFYSVAGVAVVLLIVTGVLAVRRRSPAP